METSHFTSALESNLFFSELCNLDQYKAAQRLFWMECQSWVLKRKLSYSVDDWRKTQILLRSKLSVGTKIFSNP